MFPPHALVPAGILQIAFGADHPVSIPGATILLLIGMFLITKGGDIFTDSAVAIARITRVPPVIIGATIVSIATTFPEFMVSLTGVLQGSADFAVGNALGSCLCNIGLIVGSCIVVKGILAARRGEASGIEVSRVTLSGPGVFMLSAGLMLWVFGHFDSGGADAKNAIARWQAGILVATAVLYFGYSLRIAVQSRAEADIDDSEPVGHSVWSTALLFLAGAVLVAVGSRLMVANARYLATVAGVPELVVGLTVLAVGTSLPEYTISLLAVIKGHGSLGVGNIIGANVLNIGWVVATCALVEPLPIRPQTLRLDAPVALTLMALLVGLGWKRERLSTPAGILMLVIYAGYLITLITIS